MRISGWHRIGVVASVIWAISAGAYKYKSDYHLADSAASAVGQECLLGLDGNASGQAALNCVGNEIDLRRNLLSDGFDDRIAFCILPIILGWIIFYAAYGIWIWIRAGFRPNSN
jgi:hypothetical protein